MMVFEIKPVGPRWVLIGRNLVETDMEDVQIKYFDSAEEAATECERRNSCLLRE